MYQNKMYKMHQATRNSQLVEIHVHYGSNHKQESLMMTFSSKADAAAEI